MSTELKIESVVAKVFELRGRKAQRALESNEIDKMLRTLETYLLKVMIDADIDSMGVLLEDGHATVSHKTKTSISVADFDEVLAFAKKNNAFHILTKGVSGTSVKELLASGVEVPGVNMYSEEVVSVTRK